MLQKRIYWLKFVNGVLKLIGSIFESNRRFPKKRNFRNIPFTNMFIKKKVHETVVLKADQLYVKLIIC